MRISRVICCVAALIAAAFLAEGQSTFITGPAGEFNGSIWTGGDTTGTR